MELRSLRHWRLSFQAPYERLKLCRYPHITSFRLKVSKKNLLELLTHFNLWKYIHYRPQPSLKQSGCDEQSKLSSFPCYTLFQAELPNELITRAILARKQGRIGFFFFFLCWYTFHFNALMSTSSSDLKLQALVLVPTSYTLIAKPWQNQSKQNYRTNNPLNSQNHIKWWDVNMTENKM